MKKQKDQKIKSLKKLSNESSFHGDFIPFSDDVPITKRLEIIRTISAICSVLLQIVILLKLFHVI